MSDQSANEAYDLIVHWLRDNDLEWVAKQIEDEIIIGKPKHGRISVPKPAPQVDGRPARALVKAPTSAEFLAREDYTPLEKFEIAIGALDALVTGAIKIQDSLLNTLSHGADPPRVIFAPADSDTSTYHFESADLTERRIEASELSELLGKLRKEVVT
jgi:hypothetical protein